MVETTLRLFNPWWTKDFTSPGILRKEYLQRLENMLGIQKIAILFGLRRVGKTFIMKQFISKLIPAYGADRIFYASLDHPKIRGLSIIDLLSEFRRICRAGRSEDQILLLDEVHHRQGFENELKALHDSEEHLKIVIAGSSSLVVRHRSSALTGRYMKQEVRPLNFREYLKFNEKKYDNNEPDLMEGYMDDYLITGGMPHYVLTGEPQVLLNIVEDVVYKDIVKEHGVRNANKLNDLAYLLMDRVGKPLGYTKIGRLIGVGNDTAAQYVDYFCQTYLMALCEKDGTPNERTYAARKVYCHDNGFRVLMTGTRGIGSLAENLVFNLLRQLDHVRYHKQNNEEIDFICGDKAIEVKYKSSLTSKDYANILNLTNRKVKRKIIITKKETNSHVDIETIPLWKFAADGFS